MTEEIRKARSRLLQLRVTQATLLQVDVMAKDRGLTRADMLRSLLNAGLVTADEKQSQTANVLMTELPQNFYNDQPAHDASGYDPFDAA